MTEDLLKLIEKANALGCNEVLYGAQQTEEPRRELEKAVALFLQKWNPST